MAGRTGQVFFLEINGATIRNSIVLMHARGFITPL